jgi:hypothetical protein
MINDNRRKNIEKIKPKPVLLKSFISSKRVSLPENASRKRCTPHFFIYHIPTQEINCMQITKLYSAG